MSSDRSELDEPFMRRALRLAMNGRGHVEPNPMVGCVLVKDGRVIGEGFHAKFGGPHAEPNALANCIEPPAGATAYVTLEPCCHTNKKTPPCVPALIGAKVARAVVGCLDPNPDVNGKGLQQLRDAGVEVIGPVLEAEAKQLIAPFLARLNYNRPYVTLKWAQTADGKVAGAGGARVQISNEISTHLVHLLRSRSDAIMVGINTVLNDDPTLTPRGVPKLREPIRIVLDSRLRLPDTSAIVRTNAMDVRVFCTKQAHERAVIDDERRLRGHDIDVIKVSTDKNGRLHLPAVVEEVDSSVSHVLVEPGPTVAASFIAEQQLVDRVWVIRSTRRIDATDAPRATPVPTHYASTGTLDLAGDTLTEYLNPASPVFFAPVPSADFVLARDALVPSPGTPGEG